MPTAQAIERRVMAVLSAADREQLSALLVRVRQSAQMIAGSDDLTDQ
jgi:hypothetical protein